MLVNPRLLREYSQKMEYEKMTIRESIQKTDREATKLMMEISASNGALADYSFISLYQHSQTQLEQLLGRLNELQKSLEQEARDVEYADQYSFNLDWGTLVQNLGIIGLFNYSGLSTITSSKKENNLLIKYQGVDKVKSWKLITDKLEMTILSQGADKTGKPDCTYSGIKSDKGWTSKYTSRMLVDTKEFVNNVQSFATKRLFLRINESRI